MNFSNEFENKITKLQNLNDDLFKLVDILYRKQDNKELLTVQADLLEEYAIEMRDLLSN
jgi:hypothetical protein